MSRNLTVSSGSTAGWAALGYAAVGAFFLIISTIMWKMGKNRYVKYVNKTSLPST